MTYSSLERKYVRSGKEMPAKAQSFTRNWPETDHMSTAKQGCCPSHQAGVRFMRKPIEKISIHGPLLKPLGKILNIPGAYAVIWPHPAP